MRKRNLCIWICSGIESQSSRRWVVGKKWGQLGTSTNLALCYSSAFSWSSCFFLLVGLPVTAKFGTAALLSKYADEYTFFEMDIWFLKSPSPVLVSSDWMIWDGVGFLLSCLKFCEASWSKLQMLFVELFVSLSCLAAPCSIRQKWLKKRMVWTFRSVRHPNQHSSMWVKKTHIIPVVFVVCRA